MAKNWIMAPFNSHKQGNFDQFWGYDRENSVISIGWDVGDFDSQKELERKYWERGSQEDWKKAGLDQLVKFWYDIKQGDRIIARCGRKNIVGVGTAAGSPFYSPKMKAEQAGAFEPDHAYFLPVKWNDFKRGFPSIEFGMQTLYSVPDGRFEELVGGLMDPWDEYVRRAKEYIATERLESEEIEYKVELGRKLAEAREAALAGADGWNSLVESGINSSNIVPQFQKYRFLTWLNDLPDDVLRALRAIWTWDNLSVADRIYAFSDLFPATGTSREGHPMGISGVGTRMNVISVLLMGLDVKQYPPFRITLFDKAYERTEYDKPEKNVDEAALYEHALGFLDRFIEEASKRELPLRHRLDAQSVVWAIQDAGGGITEIDDDSEIEDKPPPPPPPPPTDPWSSEKIDDLAKDLLWEPQSKLQDIIRDLQEKGQVIFYGPPGTGKTYVAREIAKQCQLNGGDFEIVQFHPSYSYEDFVQGFRPKLHGGQPGFDLVDGPLRRIAQQAKEKPGASFILVIDELNRGNVSKVFGELYFLLEYRNEEVRLQYGGGEKFSLPSNLWFICTMNTSDRSIALMDAALRRRFYFAPFFPNEPPVQGLLRRWLHKERQDTLAADLIDEANKNLDRDTGIGPSYFMRPGEVLSEDSVRRIWERAVVPYVEEQCFGDDAKLETFRFDALKRQIGGSELAEAETPGDSIAEQASDAEPATD